MTVDIVDRIAAEERLSLRPPRVGRFLPSSKQHANQDAEPVAHARKRIVICADGTWNTPQKESDGQPTTTNVWLLYQLIKPQATDGLPQLAYYHAGVGTHGVLDRLLGGAFGVGLNSNIRDCYRFLIDHYRPGDYLYLFGFSRGAYTVRSLAGLVRNCGIIDSAKAGPAASLNRKVRAAFDLYRERDDASSPSAQKSFRFRLENSHPDFRITCIGVWDTVGALGVPVGGLAKWSKRWSFHDVALSSWVDRAFHAVAVDERRGAFEPTLWLQQASGRAKGQRLEQVWFSGVHSDVGGGYKASDRGLANVTLRWMADRVSSECRLELDTTRLESLTGREAIHDSMAWWYRLFPPCDRMIDAGIDASGIRNPARLTGELLSPSVDRYRTEYGASAMPMVGRPYRPANVNDFLRREQAAVTAPPDPVTEAVPDLRSAKVG